MTDSNCHCAPLRATLDELTRTVQEWAKVEQPRPENVDMLTRNATERIRLAALDASIGQDGHR